MRRNEKLNEGEARAALAALAGIGLGLCTTGLAIGPWVKIGMFMVVSVVTYMILVSVIHLLLGQPTGEK